MSKHTPAPWRAESDENGHWVCLPGKDTFICEMAEEVPFEEIGANARLIAESPKLLEALVEATTNGQWTEGEQRGDWVISKEVYEVMRDAIGQADPWVAE